MFSHLIYCLSIFTEENILGKVQWKWTKNLVLTGDYWKLTLSVRIGSERASTFILFHVFLYIPKSFPHNNTSFSKHSNIERPSLFTAVRSHNVAMVNTLSVMTMAGVDLFPNLSVHPCVRHKTSQCFSQSVFHLCLFCCHWLWEGSWDVTGLVEQSNQLEAGNGSAKPRACSSL